MAEAIFALVGVLVGGALIAASQWLATVREHRRGQRTAARILSAELSTWQTSIGDARRSRDLAHVDPGASVLSTWNGHRAALTGLKPDEWRTVHLAIRSVEGFSDGNASGWPRNAARTLSRTTESVQNAIGVLDAVAALSWLDKRRGAEAGGQEPSSGAHAQARGGSQTESGVIALHEAGHPRGEGTAAIVGLEPGQPGPDESEEARSPRAGRGAKNPRPGQMNLPGLG